MFLSIKHVFQRIFNDLLLGKIPSLFLMLVNNHRSG